MTVSKRLRYEILRRDNHSCRYCGATADETPLQIDHVTPTTLGGTDDPSNLVAACVECNAGKSSASPDASLVDDVAADALRWRRAMEYAAWEQSEQATIRQVQLEAFSDEWFAWMPPDWHVSVGRFLDLGLSNDDLIALARMTFTKDRRSSWHYFCGAAWGQLRQRQERAEEILRNQELRAEEVL